MRALITGGGTGGHLYPGIAVAEALARREPSLEIHFAGTSYGLEARVIPPLGWPLHLLAVRGMPRRISPALAVSALRVPVSLVQAVMLLQKLRPRFVVGTGGYASAPAVLAASALQVPIVLLEQNLAPGLVTRWLAPLAREVHVSFPETERALRSRGRVRSTGNPVRASILAATRDVAMKTLGLDGGKRTLLVIGGSRGARGLNALVAEALPLIGREPAWQCVFQTGEEEKAKYEASLASFGASVQVRGFLEDVGSAYAAADLVISRAGATTVAELTARGLPAIMVPFPWSAAGHQEENARWMEARSAAIVMSERTSRPEEVAARIARLWRDPDELARLARASASLGKPQAAETVAEAVLSL